MTSDKGVDGYQQLGGERCGNTVVRILGEEENDIVVTAVRDVVEEREKAKGSLEDLAVGKVTMSGNLSRQC